MPFFQLTILSLFFWSQAAPAQVAPGPDGPLAALGWLAGGRWVAQSDDPKAPNLMRETFFEWAPNGRALRFWSYITDRKFVRRPYVDGSYVFHPGQKAIMFSYVDAGGYYSGTVTPTADGIDHHFEGVSLKGTSQRYRYTFTKRSADEMLVHIYDRAQDEWREIVALTYRRQPH